MKQAGIILVFLFLFVFFSFSQRYNQTIRGVVTDQDSKLPISGATVAIEGIDPFLNTLTGEDGGFRFDNIPIGRFTLYVSFIGYEKVTIPNVIVNSGKEVVLNIYLQEAITQLQAVVVTSDKTRGQALN